jgi:hypothetical protein
MRSGFADLESECGLGGLDEDLLEIRNKGLRNLKTFFEHYVAGRSCFSIERFNNNYLSCAIM